MFRRSHRWLRGSLIGATVAAVLAGVTPHAQASPWHWPRDIASPRFDKVWSDADQAVVNGTATRSWTWGPRPWFDYYEFYQQSPNGLRLVQYFDKARMEINDPSVTGGALGGVTNGLLPVEMISGRIKLGNGTGPDQNQQRDPAALPVAGDPLPDNPNAPTYASFRTVATTDNGYKDQNKVGQRAGATLALDGGVGFDQNLANQSGTDIVVYDTVTGHNVPRVFNDFRNNLPGVRAIDAFGYPITDAYWVKTLVAGQARDVLVQMYERRVLTYTPTNAPNYRVEMGNVGQHYFQWRYSHLGNAWNPTYITPQPLFFASRDQGPEYRIVSYEHGTGAVLPFYGNGQNEAVPFSVARQYSGAVFPLGDARPIGKRNLIATDLYGRTRGMYVGGDTYNNYNAAVSPDGNNIVFASDRDGNPELYLHNRFGHIVQLTQTSNCTNQYPAWLPNGSGLVYETDCGYGNFEIMRAALNYTADSDVTVYATLTQVTRLTNNTTDDRYPRVAPDGKRIAFTAFRDGNSELYLMGIDGGQQQRLTLGGGRNQAPTWNAEGGELAFASDRDGDWEIFKLRLDDGEVKQLTRNSVEDNWPIWSQ